MSHSWLQDKPNCSYFGGSKKLFQCCLLGKFPNYLHCLCFQVMVIPGKTVSGQQERDTEDQITEEDQISFTTTIKTNSVVRGMSWDIRPSMIKSDFKTTAMTALVDTAEVVVEAEVAFPPDTSPRVIRLMRVRIPQPLLSGSKRRNPATINPAAASITFEQFVLRYAFWSCVHVKI